MNSNLSKSGDRSENMGGQPTSAPPAVKTRKQRIRKPRIASTFEPAEAAQLWRYAKAHKCDASHVIHESVMAILKDEDPKDAAGRINHRQVSEELRSLVLDLAFQYNQIDWQPIKARNPDSLADRWEALTATQALAEIKAQQLELLHRVATVRATFDQYYRSNRSTTTSDASHLEDKGNRTQ
jgi:hypothetical protein